MALGDMWHLSGPVTIQKFQTKAANTAIKAGEPVILGTGGDTEYVTVSAGAIDTDDTFVGIAVSADTVTTSNDGIVWVAVPSAGTVFRAKTKTIASLSTDKILTKVIIDLSASSNFILDESDTTKGFCLITGYDTTTGYIDFMVDMTETVNA